MQTTVLVWCDIVIIIEQLISETKRTHSHSLILKKFCLDCFAMLVGCGYSILCHHMITMSQHNLGCSLYIKNLFPKQWRIDNSCHILALCRECQLAEHLCTFAQLHIIGTLPVEPQKKSGFSGITDSLYHSTFFIEICRRVDCHTLFYHSTCHIGCKHLFL